MTLKEIWKDIKGYEGIYQISNTGKVNSIKRNKQLTPSPDNKGYLRVNLCKDGNYKTKRNSCYV